MSSSSFSSKSSSWFKTKVLSLFSLILFAFLLVGCGSSGGGGSSNTNTSKEDNNSNTTPPSSSKELTNFWFASGIIKNATIGEKDINITIDYNSTDLTPKVTHTGVSYSPLGRINLSTIPKVYTVTAQDNTTKDYNVTVRRAFIVSDETGLTNAIDVINGEIANPGLISYITILVEKDISLTNNKTIPSGWVGKHIALESHNLTLSNVTIKGLVIEGNGTVELKGVKLGRVIEPMTSASFAHSLALDSDGKLWGAGYNDYGQLGLGNNNNQTSFQPITISGLAPADIVYISTGGAHSLALDGDGRVWATGNNEYGQLGLGYSGNETSRNSFTQVTSLSGKTITAIAAGLAHSFALDNNGKLWATGYNVAGQLGLGYSGNGTDQNSFTQVTNLNDKNITAIAAGYLHSLVLDSAGKIWVTGYNYGGQLGLGNTISQNSFQDITSGLIASANIVSIAAGLYHSLALGSDGKLWVTGYNSYGQLGLGEAAAQEIQTSFQPIASGSIGSANIVSISAGQEHSLALDSNGKLWATGNNSYGQLGLGNTVNQYSFQAVTSGFISSVNIVSISAGLYYSFAMTNDDKVWATGSNEAGQLGLGDNITRYIFTPVPF